MDTDTYSDFYCSSPKPNALVLIEARECLTHGQGGMDRLVGMVGYVYRSVPEEPLWSRR